MNGHRLHNVVYARLEAIAAAEKITRAELGELSRELLIYVMDTRDIDIVNRLLLVLTKINAKAATLYFKHFLPWTCEEDAEGNFTRFGKMSSGEKKVKRQAALIDEWLHDVNNNIWTWADANIEIKEKDFKATVARAIKKALEGDAKSGTAALTREEIIAAIFDGGVTIDDMLFGIEAHEKALADEQEEPVAA